MKRRATAALLAFAGLLVATVHADRLDRSFNADWWFHRQDDATAGRFAPDAHDRVAAGTFPQGPAAQVIPFPACDARFVCLEALSSYNGPFASVAEFDLLDEQGRALDRANWRIVYASSEEATSGETAQKAIDGDPQTRWHSQWQGATPPPPHALVLDLGAPARIAGLRYLPRQDGNSSGLTREWRLYARAAPFALPAAANPLSPPTDAAWESVCLPHTLRLEPRNANGCRNFYGVGWYRKDFVAAPSWTGRTVLLRFDGAMQVAEITLNGRPLAKHSGGYLPFVLDLTGRLEPGRTNKLLVRLDNADNPEVPPGTPSAHLGFTRFGGLYRNAHLTVADPLHITDEYLADRVAGGGIFVRLPQVSAAAAMVEVQTEVVNGRAEAQSFQLVQELADTAGATVARASRDLTLAPGAVATCTQQLAVARPRLWHPDHPDLYTLRTAIAAGGAAIDSRTTRVGIRRLEFRPDGLFINGAKYFAGGVNRHQDHPYVGYALPDSAEWRDAKKLREAGFTSFRCHYPMSPAWMDACDELGILCVVSSPGWQFHGNRTWEERFLRNTVEMIRRDRNHPCVALWEPFPNETGYAEAFARQLNDAVHAELPGDQCFTAGDGSTGNSARFIDVAWSRDPVPGKPFWGREWGDSVDNWSDQQGRVRVARGWGEVPLLTQALNHAIKLDTMLRNTGGGPAATRMAGAGLWAGIDTYMAYVQQDFLGGPLDLFRLPKFDYYFFQSQRDPAVQLSGVDSGPMVFIASYASAYSPASVTVFSNCERVRFYENGRLVATQAPDAGYVLAHPPFTFKAKAANAEVTTYNMTPDLAANAEPGYHYRAAEYKAEGLIGDRVVATHEIRAPGMMQRIVLEPDLCGRGLAADGADWVRVYAKLCDGRGTVYPFADDEVTFAVEGEGALVGDASIGANPVHAEAGIATALVRASTRPGRITVRATVPGLAAGIATIDSH